MSTYQQTIIRRMELTAVPEVRDIKELGEHILKYIEFVWEDKMCGVSLRELNVRWGVLSKRLGSPMRALLVRLANEDRLLLHTYGTRFLVVSKRLDQFLLDMADGLAEAEGIEARRVTTQDVLKRSTNFQR